MKTNIHSDALTQEIERLVRAHIATAHRAAAEAVERAFASSRAEVLVRPCAPRLRTRAARRTRDELEAVSTRLYRVLCAKPGATMAVLAKEMGAPAAMLQRPMAVLKQRRQVESIGERHLTCYFPMVDREAALIAA
jgi:ribose 1,5-bisphosphokinase PhnN